MKISSLKNWIAEQTLLNLAQFEKAMKEHYPETRHWVNDPYKS